MTSTDRSAQPAAYGRARWLRPEEYDDAQRRAHAAVVRERAQDDGPAPTTDGDGRLVGPYAAMLAHPPVAEATQALGSAVRYHSVLAPRSREIAILAVATWCRSGFEWSQHAGLGAAVGLTDEELHDLAIGRPAGSFSPVEALVWQVVTTLLTDDDLDDDLFERVRHELGDPGLVDLLALTGHYQMLARSLRVWRTPVPSAHGELTALVERTPTGGSA